MFESSIVTVNTGDGWKNTENVSSVYNVSKYVKFI